MVQGITTAPEYLRTIERLENAKRHTGEGQEYWLARDLHPLLGYPVWDKFVPVLERASDAFKGNGVDPSHHIARTRKMMEVGRGGKREGDDYYLSRAACSLIAMNGEPTKPEIAACQAYFVVQTRRMELHDQFTDDERRLELREKVAKSFREISGVAKKAGVRNHKQAIFHDARYHGLYGMGSRDVKIRKGLDEKSNLFDRAGPLELSANEFQMNLAAAAIEKEGVRGEQQAINKNRQIAADVRKVIKDSGSALPENLALAEPIANVKKRVRAQKKLSGPTYPNVLGRRA